MSFPFPVDRKNPQRQDSQDSQVPPKGKLSRTPTLNTPRAPPSATAHNRDVFNPTRASMPGLSQMFDTSMYTTASPRSTFVDNTSQWADVGLPSPLRDEFVSPLSRVHFTNAEAYDGDAKLRPRNLILCFDGTAKYYNDGNTNVIRLFEGLDKKKTDRQICYYQPGIGTYVSPTKAFGQISRRASKAIDMAVAWYLEDHIMGGYRFLMENYREGDRICLFGFSRGAYTARCLAGMLHIVGLLPKGNEEQIPFAYSQYKDSSEAGVKKAHGFKKAFSRHIIIDFMGVWDSVTSVGLAGRTLPFTSHNAIVKVFRQALALDERRAKFRHNPWAGVAFDEPASPQRPLSLGSFRSLWSRSTENGEERPTFSQGAKAVGRAIRNTVLLRQQSYPTHYRPDGNRRDKHAEKCSECSFPWGTTDCKEVWFIGSHSDVGGGQVNTSDPKHKNNLANPSLLWMVQQIELSGLDIYWAPDAFDDIPTLKAWFQAGSHRDQVSIASSTDFDMELPTSVIEQLRKDVQCPVHDTLGSITPWWILECFPLWKHFIDESKQQWKELHMNRGRGREIRHTKTPLFHCSVQYRLEDQRLLYTPRASIHSTTSGERRFVNL